MFTTQTLPALTLVAVCDSTVPVGDWPDHPHEHGVGPPGGGVAHHVHVLVLRGLAPALGLLAQPEVE